MLMFKGVVNRVAVPVMAALVSLSGALAVAQNYQMDPMTTEGQGNLLTIRLVIGEKKAKIFMVGKETAKINLEKDAKIIEVTAFKNDIEKEQLAFTPGEGYYTIKKLPEWTSPYELRVKTKVKSKEEEIRLKVKP